MAITIDKVRNKSGADNTNAGLIEDTRIQGFIDISTEQAYNHFNFKSVPTDYMEFLRCYDINNITLSKIKVMTVKEININGTNRDISTFTFDEDSGKLQTEIRHNLFFGSLPKTNPYRIKVKYSYAMLKPEGTTTETTSDILSGDVSVYVDDESSFDVGDYVRIQGFDGFKEVAKITDTDINKITLDKLYYSHISGSIIEKMEVPSIINDYILTDCAYQVANYIVGNTSNLPTSWSQEGESSTIGVAYTHWRDSRDSFKGERDRIESDVWKLKTRVL